MKCVTNLFDCPSCFVHADEETLINCFVGLLNITGVGVEQKQLPCILTGGLPRFMYEQLCSYTLYCYNEQLCSYTVYCYNLLFLSVYFFVFLIIVYPEELLEDIWLSANIS
jgi:hypothetical protein